MKREHRYMVAKYKDVLAYLAEAEQQQLLSLFRTIHIGREEDGKRNLECVCVEDDWPEYEIVWSMIATRVDGGTPSVIQTLSERREVGMNGTVVDCLKSEVAELRAALAAEPTMPLLPLPPAQSSEQSLEAAIMALMPKCDDSTQFVCGYLQSRNDAAALVASARPSAAQAMPAEGQAQPQRIRELECVIADLTAECKSLRAEQPAVRELTDADHASIAPILTPIFLLNVVACIASPHEVPTSRKREVLKGLYRAVDEMHAARTARSLDGNAGAGGA